MQVSKSVWERFLYQVDYRLEVSETQKRNYPNDALRRLPEKAGVILVQGFGRFGPFGPRAANSEIRYDLRQDWGVFFWLPLVCFGFYQAVRLGLAELRGRQAAGCAGRRCLGRLRLGGGDALSANGVGPLSASHSKRQRPAGCDRSCISVGALLATTSSRRALARDTECEISCVSPLPGSSSSCFGSFAFFWHSRDWNTASRLMLTYALVDRGTVMITGLEVHTEDKARFQGDYYSDKLPGFAFLGQCLTQCRSWSSACLPIRSTRPWPVAHWAADYWVTLFTSGLFTALTGALVVYWSRCLGCTAGRAALLGLAYGLATPAFVYATLAYGHQATAFALFTSFFLLWKKCSRRRPVLVFLAGFLAAYGGGGRAECRTGLGDSRPLSSGSVPSPRAPVRRPRCSSESARRSRRLLLLGYNQLAFGSPWEMGYFHHATPRVCRGAQRRNPLGLAFPESFWEGSPACFGEDIEVLLSTRRSCCSPCPGGSRSSLAAALAWRSSRSSSWAAVLLVNVCYPEWTGGWSTGPRLLVPLLPFAVLPIAGLLAGDSPFSKVATWAAFALAIAGGAEMFLFQGVGGRIPQDIAKPLVEAVWPLWSGAPLPIWHSNERFCQNLAVIAAPEWIARCPVRWQGIQFLPLLIFQLAGILGVWRFGLDCERADTRAEGMVERAGTSP